MKSWNYELKHGESAECLAIGSGWCAVQTNFNYIRIFSTEGIQKHLICQGTQLVTMVGYENFLAVVYHAGPAFLASQSMRVKIINMATRDYKTMIDVECPISPNSIMTWAGFSEEGQVFTFDSMGVLRSFSYTEQQWTVRLDFKQRYSSIFKQVWIVGVYESEILFIEMPKDHDAPSMIARNATRRVKMSSPLLDIDTEIVDGKELTLPQMEAQLQNMWLNLEHEIFRK